jgi:ribonuclease BN (tRNA processing enzyme)
LSPRPGGCYSRLVLLTVVGSADAFNSAGRGHSCYIVQEQDAGPIMVDFGATALAGLKRLGRRPTDIRGFAITHLHGDHIAGFAFSWIDALFNQRRTKPLSIVGPLGTRDRLDDLLRTTYGPIADLDLPFELTIEEIAPGASASLCGFEVSAFEADHMDPPERPLCLRVSAPSGRTVAFSGDTQMSAGLLEAAEGVDLLVAECTGLRHPVGRHCAWEDWVRVLPTLTARRVLFSHLGEDVRAAAEREELTVDGADFSFADDGQVVRL